MPFMLIEFLFVGVFQSIGMGKRVLQFAILRKIVLEVPFMIILNFLFHANGIAFAGLISEGILAIYGYSILKHVIRRLKLNISK